MGAPGGGKSTLAAALTDALGDAAVLIPMDGFHLAQKELVRLGRRDRMGAPDTFDAAGYVALLERVRAARETVYAPEFRRPPEEPIAGAIAIPPDVPLDRHRGQLPAASTRATGRACGRSSTRSGTSTWTRPRGSTG